MEARGDVRLEAQARVEGVEAPGRRVVGVRERERGREGERERGREGVDGRE